MTGDVIQGSQGKLLRGGKKKASFVPRVEDDILTREQQVQGPEERIKLFVYAPGYIKICGKLPSLVLVELFAVQYLPMALFISPSSSPRTHTSLITLLLLLQSLDSFRFDLKAFALAQEVSLFF